MDEIFETIGPAILSAMGAAALIGIATFLLFNKGTPGSGVVTLYDYMFAVLDSIIP